MEVLYNLEKNQLKAYKAKKRTKSIEYWADLLKIYSSVQQSVLRLPCKIGYQDSRPIINVTQEKCEKETFFCNIKWLYTKQK